MSKDKESTVRQSLIEIGADIVSTKGFRGTGIKEILDRAGVPKGSFYHYFKSKDEFGLAIVEHYKNIFMGHVNEFLSDDSVPPLHRMARFFGFYHAMFQDNGFTGGSAIGNMSQEMGDIDERFSRSLDEIFIEASGVFASCIEEAINEGTTPAHLNPIATAQFILNSWEGAILRMKVSKNEEPLRVFEDMVFSVILKQ